MLPKKERLNRTAFSRFFSAGKRIHSPSFMLVYAAHEALHASVVVPKKVLKSAVARNRLRRQIYDMVRRHRTEQTTNGVYIFLVKSGAVGKGFEDLQKEVLAGMAKART